MTIDVSAIGWRSESTKYRYGWQQLALYALGIGAQIAELQQAPVGVEGEVGGERTWDRGRSPVLKAPRHRVESELVDGGGRPDGASAIGRRQIVRASCRERV